MIYTKAFGLVILVAVVAAKSIETSTESWDDFWKENEIDTDYYDDYGFWNETISFNDTSGILDPHENTTTEDWDDFWKENEIDTDHYDDYGFGNETNSFNETSGLLDPHENTTTEEWDDFWAESDWENHWGIRWMRPEEIARYFGYKKPLLFKDGHTRFDINQGYIGDCWFLAALALLPAYPKVFNNVLVDRKQSFENNPAGKQYKSQIGIDMNTIFNALQCQGFSGSSFGNTVNGLKLSSMIIFPPLMASCCS